MGTTGEAPTLSAVEKKQVLSTIINVAQDRCPVLTGHVAGNDTTSMLKLLKDTDLKSLYGFMISTPPYNKPNQRGLYQHFLTLDSESSLPILLYNIPGRTSVNLSLDTILKLATTANHIIGVKEASGNLDTFSQLIHDKPENFVVLSGDDTMALAQTSIGGDGVISVLANAFPKEFSDMIRLALANDIHKAAKINMALWPFHKHLYSEGNPTGIKALLTMMNRIKNHLRLPLIEISTETYTLLENCYTNYKRI